LPSTSAAPRSTRRRPTAGTEGGGCGQVRHGLARPSRSRPASASVSLPPADASARRPGFALPHQPFRVLGPKLEASHEEANRSARSFQIVSIAALARPLAARGAARRSRGSRAHAGRSRRPDSNRRPLHLRAFAGPGTWGVAGMDRRKVPANEPLCGAARQSPAHPPWQLRCSRAGTPGVQTELQNLSARRRSQ
jgi:hypothetical protein